MMATKAVKFIPDGYPTVTPYLVVPDVEAVIEFTSAVFDAKDRYRMPGPDGRAMHAEIEIGDSLVMTGRPQDESDMMPAMLNVYVEDVDAAYRRALDAGAISTQEPTDQFYGDRTAGVKDTTGNLWYIATHKEDVPEEEVARRAAEQS
jgi:PhnB protein